MMKTKTEQLKLIQALSNASGPSGFEDEVVAIAGAAMSDIARIEEDSLRNVYFYPKSNRGNRPIMLLDAHSDEVGFMVHSIRPNGSLRFLNLGSWSLSSLPSSRVRVRNRHGEYISGIIAAKPVHFMSEAEKQRGGPSSISELSIDVGATSAKEAEELFGLRIGEPIVSDTLFSYDEKRDVLQGKGFDCRLGCAALIETMHRLAGEELAVDVVGVLSSQEEVGERGIRVAVNRVKPQVALCFEGCPADDTFTEAYAVQTALKKGPMLRFMDKSVICNPRYQRFALDLAQERGLEVQCSVREGGGNNGAIIHNALEGVPVLVAGVPVRYIHSHYGISSFYDYEATVQLAVELVKAMTPERIAGF